MTIYKAGTMLTLTNELGTLRGALSYDWNSATNNLFSLTEGTASYAHRAADWTITPDRTLPTDCTLPHTVTAEGIKKGDTIRKESTDSPQWLAIEYVASYDGDTGWLYTSDTTLTILSHAPKALPTTPGSVVRGDVDGEQETLAMSDSDVLWFKLSGSNGWYMADQITNWTLLFDAAAEVSE